MLALACGSTYSPLVVWWFSEPLVWLAGGSRSEKRLARARPGRTEPMQILRRLLLAPCGSRSSARLLAHSAAKTPQLPLLPALLSSSLIPQ